MNRTKTHKAKKLNCKLEKCTIRSSVLLNNLIAVMVSAKPSESDYIAKSRIELKLRENIGGLLGSQRVYYIPPPPKLLEGITPSLPQHQHLFLNVPKLQEMFFRPKFSLGPTKIMQNNVFSCTSSSHCLLHFFLGNTLPYCSAPNDT